MVLYLKAHLLLVLGSVVQCITVCTLLYLYAVLMPVISMLRFWPSSTVII